MHRITVVFCLALFFASMASATAPQVSLSCVNFLWDGTPEDDMDCTRGYYDPDGDAIVECYMENYDGTEWGNCDTFIAKNPPGPGNYEYIYHVIDSRGEKGTASDIVNVSTDYFCGWGGSNCFVETSYCSQNGETYDLGIYPCANDSANIFNCNGFTEYYTGLECCVDAMAFGYGCENEKVCESQAFDGGKTFDTYCSLDYDDGFTVGEESCVKDPNDVWGTDVACCDLFDCPYNLECENRINYGWATCSSDYVCAYPSQQSVQCCVDVECYQPNVSYWCNSNTCGYGNCSSGYADCDGSITTNGCECDLSTHHCEGTSCISGESIQCSDGTWAGNCSIVTANRGKYCENQGGNGVLVDGCNTHGCSSECYSYEECSSSTEQCYVPNCADGTPPGECSVTKPSYCDSQGGWHANYCNTCGCELGYECRSTGECVFAGTPECVIDGDCESDEICQFGRCVNSSPTETNCAESEGGQYTSGVYNPLYNSIELQATCIDRTGTFVDLCVDSFTVREFACDSSCNPVEITCPEGTICLEGKCGNPFEGNGKVNVFAGEGETIVDLADEYFGVEPLALKDAWVAEADALNVDVWSAPDGIFGYGVFDGINEPVGCLFSENNSDPSGFQGFIESAQTVKKDVLCVFDSVDNNWLAVSILSSLNETIENDSTFYEEKGYSFYFDEFFTPHYVKVVKVRKASGEEFEIEWYAVEEAWDKQNELFAGNAALNRRLLSHLFKPLEQELVAWENSQGELKLVQANTLVESAATGIPSIENMLNNPLLVETPPKEDLKEFAQYIWANSQNQEGDYPNSILRVLKRQSKINGPNSLKLIKGIAAQQESLGNHLERIQRELAISKPMVSEALSEEGKYTVLLPTVPHLGLAPIAFGLDKDLLPLYSSVNLKNAGLMFLSLTRLRRIGDWLGFNDHYKNLFSDWETAMQNYERIQLENADVMKEVFGGEIPETLEELRLKWQAAADKRNGSFVNPLYNFYMVSINKAAYNQEYDAFDHLDAMQEMAQEYQDLRLYIEEEITRESMLNTVYDLYYPIEEKSETISRLELASEEMRLNAGYMSNDAFTGYQKPYFNIREFYPLKVAITQIEEHGEVVFQSNDPVFDVPLKYFPEGEIRLTFNDLDYLNRAAFRKAPNINISDGWSKETMLRELGLPESIWEIIQPSVDWLKQNSKKQYIDIAWDFLGAEDVFLLIQPIKAAIASKSLLLGQEIDLAKLGMSIDKLEDVKAFWGIFDNQVRKAVISYKVDDAGRVLASMHKVTDIPTNFSEIAAKSDELLTLVEKSATITPAYLDDITASFETEQGIELIFDGSTLTNEYHVARLVAKNLDVLPEEMLDISRVHLFTEEFPNGKLLDETMFYYDAATKELYLSAMADPLLHPRTLSASLLSGVGEAAADGLGSYDKTEMMINYLTIRKYGNFMEGDLGAFTGGGSQQLFKPATVLEAANGLSAEEGFRIFYSQTLRKMVLDRKALKTYIQGLSGESQLAWNNSWDHFMTRLGTQADDISEILSAENALRKQFALDLAAYGRIATDLAASNPTTAKLFEELAGTPLDEWGKTGAMGQIESTPFIVNNPVTGQEMLIPSLMEFSGQQTISLGEYKLFRRLSNAEAAAVIVIPMAAEKFGLLNGNGWGWSHITDDRLRGYIEIAKDLGHPLNSGIAGSGFDSMEGLQQKIEECVAQGNYVYSGSNRIYSMQTGISGIEFLVITNEQTKEVLDAYLKDESGPIEH